MKKLSAFTAVLLSLTSLFATDEAAIRKILLENIFSASGSLHRESISFSESEDRKLLFRNEIWSSDTSPNYMLIEGTAKIKRNTISLLIGKCSESNAIDIKTWEEAYSKLELFDKPGFEYRYKLGRYTTEAPKDGEIIYSGDFKCVKKTDEFVSPETLLMYTKPDKNSDLYISNFIYNYYKTHSYKGINTYQLPAGVQFQVLAEIKDSGNTKDEKGIWYLISNIYDETANPWIFVPDSLKLEKWDSKDVFDISSVFKNEFNTAVHELELCALSTNEWNIIDNRKGCHFYNDITDITASWQKIVNKNDFLKTDLIFNLEDNLKLRKGPTLQDEKILTAKKGTKVKILELGTQDVIDNIFSCWVKVEILSNAVDRDGKPIQKNTVGWCFGGYLSMSESFELELSAQEKIDILNGQSVWISGGVIANCYEFRIHDNDNNFWMEEWEHTLGDESVLLDQEILDLNNVSVFYKPSENGRLYYISCKYPKFNLYYGAIQEGTLLGDYVYLEPSYYKVIKTSERYESPSEKSQLVSFNDVVAYFKIKNCSKVYFGDRVEVYGRTTEKIPYKGKYGYWYKVIANVQDYEHPDFEMNYTTYTFWVFEDAIEKPKDSFYFDEETLEITGKEIREDGGLQLSVSEIDKYGPMITDWSHEFGDLYTGGIYWE